MRSFTTDEATTLGETAESFALYMSFLAIDIGNTRLKWACYDQPRFGARLLAHGVEFLEQIESLSDTAWKQLPTPVCMLGCVVAGDAVKQRVQEQLELWPDLYPRWVVSRAEQAGLVNGYDIAHRLGADRWVAMIGARQHMARITAGGAPKPFVLVMIGTAVTIEAVDADGKFLGGIILPGHGMMLRALQSGTSGLHVPTGQVVPFPTNTSDALTSGGAFAIVGAVERMLGNLRAQTGQEPLCFMTGGAGWKVAPYIQGQFELVESLIFDGLLTLAAFEKHCHPDKLIC